MQADGVGSRYRRLFSRDPGRGEPFGIERTSKKRSFADDRNPGLSVRRKINPFKVMRADHDKSDGGIEPTRDVSNRAIEGHHDADSITVEALRIEDINASV